MPTKKQPAKRPTKTRKTIPKKKKKPVNKRKQGLWKNLTARVSNFTSRRPHRSFQKTKRRDYVRSLELPGYFAFTFYVMRTLLKNKRTFLYLILTFTVANVLFVSIASQDTYTQLAGVIRDTSGDLFKGNWGQIGQAGLLLFTGITGNFSSEPTEAQQIFQIFILLLMWLAVVWLLRAQLAGNTPRLRDALYNSGSPIVPTLFISILLIVELLPLGLAVLGFNVALQTGFLDQGIISMVFSVVALLLVTLSVYLVSSTFFALIIATLPGMFPWQAIRTAGDLVIGRRIRLILRLAWMLLAVAVMWAIIMIPVFLGVSWLQTTYAQTAWIPIIPYSLVLMTVITGLFSSSYIYLLYRKVVEDDAQPT